MVTRKRVEPNQERLNRVVADARRAREEREKSYCGQALKLFPWICGRCAREFDHANVHELTVQAVCPPGGTSAARGATHTPFADLRQTLRSNLGLSQ
jgi:hypothetical protein